jgi:hypothetical protein
MQRAGNRLAEYLVAELAPRAAGVLRECARVMTRKTSIEPVNRRNIPQAARIHSLQRRDRRIIFGGRQRLRAPGWD